MIRMKTQIRNLIAGLLLSQILLAIAFVGVRLALPRIFADKYLSNYTDDVREDVISDLTEGGVREMIVLGPLHLIGIVIGVVLLIRTSLTGGSTEVDVRES